MEKSRSPQREFSKNERGFTLPEVLITIVILGIILVIATSTWWSVVESRRVDSATNQLASDLRLAHSRATNQLADYKVEMDTGTRNYRMYREECAGQPPTCTWALVGSPSLTEEGTVLTTATSAVTFKADGSTSVSGEVTVAADHGSPSHTITFDQATSRVKID
jgi:prepilin-type N-terminal cleavage/methylation domain-containing protein